MLITTENKNDLRNLLVIKSPKKENYDTNEIINSSKFYWFKGSRDRGIK